MALRSDQARWGSAAQTFHWLMALIIITMGIVGWVMTNLPNSPDKIKIYALHKSMGLTILALALLRLAWRAYDGRPPELPMPRWQALGSRCVHVMLYALMLAMPLSGWLFNSASNFPLRWFGLISLPNLTGGENLPVKAFARAAHLYLFWVLFVAFVLHVGAALKHHFVDRDDVLRRMLPRRGRAPPPPASGATTADPAAQASNPAE